MRFDPDAKSHRFIPQGGGIDLESILGITSAKTEVLSNKAGLTNSMALVRYEAMVTSITRLLAKLGSIFELHIIDGGDEVNAKAEATAA